MKASRLLILAAAAVLVTGAPALAFHDGGVAACNGCHTMHNSQNGAADELQRHRHRPRHSPVGPGLHRPAALREQDRRLPPLPRRRRPATASGRPTPRPRPSPTRTGAAATSSSCRRTTSTTATAAPRTRSSATPRATASSPASRAPCADPVLTTSPGGTFPASRPGLHVLPRPARHRLLPPALPGRPERGHRRLHRPRSSRTASPSPRRTARRRRRNHNAYHGGYSAWCGTCHGDFHQTVGQPDPPLGRAPGQRHRDDLQPLQRHHGLHRQPAGRRAPLRQRRRGHRLPAPRCPSRTPRPRRRPPPGPRPPARSPASPATAPTPPRRRTPAAGTSTSRAWPRTATSRAPTRSRIRTTPASARCATSATRRTSSTSWWTSPRRGLPKLEPRRPGRKPRAFLFAGGRVPRARPWCKWCKWCSDSGARRVVRMASRASHEAERARGIVDRQDGSGRGNRPLAAGVRGPPARPPWPRSRSAGGPGRTSTAAPWSPPPPPTTGGLQSDLLEQQYTLGLFQPLTPYLTRPLRLPVLRPRDHVRGRDQLHPPHPPAPGGAALQPASGCRGGSRSTSSPSTTPLEAENFDRRSLAANLSWRPVALARVQR